MNMTLLEANNLLSKAMGKPLGKRGRLSAGSDSDETEFKPVGKPVGKPSGKYTRTPLIAITQNAFCNLNCVYPCIHANTLCEPSATAFLGWVCSTLNDYTLNFQDHYDGSILDYVVSKCSIEALCFILNYARNDGTGIHIDPDRTLALALNQNSCNWPRRQEIINQARLRIQTFQSRASFIIHQELGSSLPIYDLRLLVVRYFLYQVI